MFAAVTWCERSFMADSGQGSRAGSAFFSVRVLMVLILLLPPLLARVACYAPGGATDRLVRRWARRTLRWSGCRVTVSGAEHLQSIPCALLIANHSSAIDSIVLMASLRADSRFVANHRLAARPFIGSFADLRDSAATDRVSLRSVGRRTPGSRGGRYRAPRRRVGGLVVVGCADRAVRANCR